jgi:cation transport regulator ChaC
VSARETVWYFGYGSNVDPRTFLGRRRMRPLETAAARLSGWRLVFDLGVGPGERAVANVRREPDEHIWGVAYRLDSEAAVRLDRSEGVHRGFYQRQPVELGLRDDRSIEAYTLRSDHGKPGRKPSRRYLGLLLAGARHHALPEDWIAWLRAHELAVDERSAQQELL